MNKLKPCPFCGGKPTVLYDCEGTIQEIVCLNDGCLMTVETAYSHDEQDHFRDWNRRAKVTK